MRDPNWTDTPDTCAPGAQSGGAFALLDWEDFLERYSSLIYSIPVRFGLDRQDADDVFQATCLTILRRRDAWPGPERLIPWLVSIASWESRRVLRRRSPTYEDPELLERIPRLGEPAPAELVAELERARVVFDALATLPTRDQRVLRALFLSHDETSYDDLADRLGLARGSIGSLRGRALQRLRRELERRGI